MVAKESELVRHGRVHPSQRDGPPIAGAVARSARAKPLTGDVPASFAGHRWARQVIAWSLWRGVNLARRGRTPQALRIMRRLASLAPDSPVVQLCLARLASSLGDLETAVPAMQAALATGSSKAHRYRCRVAALMLRLQELDAAEACLVGACSAFPDSSRVWLLTGELYRYRGKNDDAVRCYERALALATTKDEQHRVLAGLARCCADTGHADRAVAVSHRMIEISPNSAQGYYYLVNCHRGTDVPDDTTESMARMLGSKRLPMGQRMSLHYSLAAVCDSRGEYGEAFAHLMSANDIRARLKGRLRTGPLKEQLEATIKVFNAEFIAAMSKHGCQDDFLLCVVGFPRSGTTLTEQILSSHPGVIGLGERVDFHRAARGMQTRLESRHPYPRCCSAMKPEHIRKLANTVRAQLCANADLGARVVTKCPGDCWEVGLIKILFPRARFVYCRRNPIDNCLSCYMQCFAGVLFSTDLSTLAEVYRLYRQVMGHWLKVLPRDSIFDCPYEAMVTDPEPLVRGLHEHCGIPFNENWPRFHDHARRVDTASLWQIRRPIYQTSVNRWKNYARFLGPLLHLEED